jgi:ribonuclease BN (tRNA processing enzyme)
MRITLLGSGTGAPLRGRSPPGFAIEAGGGEESRAAVVLVDPGPGAIQRLAQYGVPLERLAHVLISHLHPDHTADLVPLLFALKLPRYRERMAPPALFGPPGLRQLYRRLCEAFGSAVDHGERLSITEAALSGAKEAGRFYKAGLLEVTAYPTLHSEGSMAFRIEARGGRAFTYSGDTDYCQGVIDAARNADLLLIECSFPEGKKVAGHLVPSEVGRIAAAAGARRVLLTHLYPECQGEDLLSPCRKYFSGRVDLAEDGMSIEL